MERDDLFPPVENERADAPNVAPLYELAADTFFDQAERCLFCRALMEDHYLWIEYRRGEPYIRSLNVPRENGSYSTCWVNPADADGFTQAVEEGHNREEVKQEG